MSFYMKFRSLPTGINKNEAWMRRYIGWRLAKWMMQ